MSWIYSLDGSIKPETHGELRENSEIKDLKQKNIQKIKLANSLGIQLAGINSALYC